VHEAFGATAVRFAALALGARAAATAAIRQQTTIWTGTRRDIWSLRRRPAARS
jgi:hypothetical protein